VTTVPLNGNPELVIIASLIRCVTCHALLSMRLYFREIILDAMSFLDNAISNRRNAHLASVGQRNGPVQPWKVVVTERVRNGAPSRPRCSDPNSVGGQWGCASRAGGQCEPFR